MVLFSMLEVDDVVLNQSVINDIINMKFETPRHRYFPLT